jgi:putative two-component system response regulator
LRGEEIPLGARIVAVADVFQALTSDRPYRKAYTTAEALVMMRGGAGTQFEPRLIDILCGFIEARNSPRREAPGRLRGEDPAA